MSNQEESITGETQGHRVVVAGDWAYGHQMPYRIQFERLQLIERYGDSVSFDIDNDGARSFTVIGGDEEKGDVTVWVPADLIMDAPAINSIAINKHGYWAPWRRFTAIVTSEFEFRADDENDQNWQQAARQEFVRDDFVGVGDDVIMPIG